MPSEKVNKIQKIISETIEIPSENDNFYWVYAGILGKFLTSVGYKLPIKTFSLFSRILNANGFEKRIVLTKNSLLNDIYWETEDSPKPFPLYEENIRVFKIKFKDF